jgi:hypothetical protein
METTLGDDDRGGDLWPPVLLFEEEDEPPAEARPGIDESARLAGIIRL